MMNLTLTLFFFNFNSLQNRSRRLCTKAVKNQSPWVDKIVEVFNLTRVLDGCFNTLLVSALKPWPLLNYAQDNKQEGQQR